MAVFNGKMSKQPRDAQLLGSPSYFIDLRDLIFEPTYVWWGGVTKQRHQLVTVLVMKDVLLNCVGTPSLLYLHGLWLKSEHHKNIAKICKKKSSRIVLAQASIATCLVHSETGSTNSLQDGPPRPPQLCLWVYNPI